MKKEKTDKESLGGKNSAELLYDAPKNKKLKITAMVLGLVLIVGVSFFGGYLTRGALLDKDLQTIDYILSMYRLHYFDEVEDVVSVFENALLDNYSEYLTPEEYAEQQKSKHAQKQNIGISCYDDLVVSSVFGNSPAQNAGINVGYKIIGYKNTADSDFTSVTTVKELADFLEATAENVDFELKFTDLKGKEKTGTLSMRSYTEAYAWYYDATGLYGFSDASGAMQLVQLDDTSIYDFGLDAETAMIRYSYFNGVDGGLNGSVGQFEACLELFKSQGKNKLIVDLRGNGGGFLNIFANIAPHLILGSEYQGKTVSILNNRDKYNKSQILKTDGNVDAANYGIESLVFLANSQTASASESLIGCALDYDTAGKVKVILEKSTLNYAVDNQIVYSKDVYKTYGKGIVQTTYPNLLTGAAIKLTTAKNYWPISDISIHGTGITADDSFNAKIGLAPSGEKRVVEESALGCFQDALSLFK